MPTGTNRSLTRRVWNKWRRYSIDRYARREFKLVSDVPYVSFTFDDFPRTAFTEGGAILRRRGARGTYFVSMQLLGKPSPSGPIATPGDMKTLVADGHELGCHTYEHLDGCDSSVDAFERSIEQNRTALADVLPGVELPIFAYPLNGPVLSIKRAVGKHFVGCRGAGQAFNSGVIDLNLLKAFFLDWRNRGDIDAVREVVKRNAAERGWLIFATHDVASEPSTYGCQPEFFEEAVRLSIESGARVVPMMEACAALGIAR